jgi:hypothetical protein
MPIRRCASSRERRRDPSCRERLQRVQAKTAGLRFDDSATDLVRQDRERE